MCGGGGCSKEQSRCFGCSAFRASATGFCCHATLFGVSVLHKVLTQRLLMRVVQHVVVLGQRLQHGAQPAAADAARHVLRQLRGDGEPMRLLVAVMCAMTLVCADCCVLCERCREWNHVLSVVAHGCGEPSESVVAVRPVLWAHVLRQLHRGSGVGGVDAEPCFAIHCQQPAINPHPC